jgi:hypothetical protein
MQEHVQSIRPVIHVDLVGNMANRMIQYMVAMKFRSLAPGCIIANVDLPDWRISHPPLPSIGKVAAARQQHHFDMAALTTAMNAGTVQRVEYHGFGQRLENFFAPEFYQEIFVSPFQEKLGFGSDVLLCPIRAGDIVDGSAPDYPLTPPKFYADVVALTGLTPVFMGQTASNRYTDRLRQQFPKALFLESRGPMRDFETIRQSKNIVVGVSTFIWLAAWLSTAETIHLVVSGLFNPMQKHLVDLLPFDDQRYRFYLFPLNYGCGPAEQEAAECAIAPYWRAMPAALLQQQFAAAPRFARSIDDFLAVYDEAYYVASNPDIREAIAAGWLADGLSHYQRGGFNDRRFPFPLDRKWYAMNYPMAAFEVAQGDYTDFTHHYLAAGKARGYRPLPDL